MDTLEDIAAIMVAMADTLKYLSQEELYERFENNYDTWPECACPSVLQKGSVTFQVCMDVAYEVLDDTNVSMDIVDKAMTMLKNTASKYMDLVRKHVGLIPEDNNIIEAATVLRVMKKMAEVYAHDHPDRIPDRMPGVGESLVIKLDDWMKPYKDCGAQILKEQEHEAPMFPREVMRVTGLVGGTIITDRFQEKRLVPAPGYRRTKIERAIYDASGTCVAFTSSTRKKVVEVVSMKQVRRLNDDAQGNVASQNSVGTAGGHQVVETRDGSARGTSTADRLRKKLQQKQRDQGSGSTSSPPGGDQAWADAHAFADAMAQLIIKEEDKTEAPSQSKKSKRRAAKKAANKAAIEERSLAQAMLAQAMDEAYSCDEDEQPEQPTPPAAATAELPAELFCPLTHELMVDPVLLVESGQTYERAPLVRWLETHDTDPMTGTHLTNRDITENILVRSMCRRYA
tara:strand:- start:921 stop:2288 length:1368 start_codon:yes stop_codon:yes gene_type:complete